MLRIFALTFAPLLSLLILLLGNGLFTTLLTVRLSMENADPLIIGGVTAAYYAGMVLGAFRIESFIVRVGHIRAFAAFASVLAVVSLLPGIYVSHAAWLILRFIGGYCLAGLFIVIESWLLSCSSTTTRGQVLALFMIVYYAAQGLGQFLLNISNPKSLIPFCITTMLCSLSVVPLAVTYVSSPKVEEPSALTLKQLYKISPTGVMGSFTAGLITGAIYGLLPLFVSQLKHSVASVALIMGLTIFGAMALQYPIGRLSDFLPRRNLLIGVCVAVVLFSIGIIFTAHEIQAAYLIFVFIFGGLAFTIYPLSINHVCDQLQAKDFISATQGLLLINGAGCIAGPLIAPEFMQLGPRGLFVFFAILAALLAMYLVWRSKISPALAVDKQQEYVAIPRTTPVVHELDPRVDE